MSNTMEEWQEGMKRELCYVYVNGGETALAATLTDDYGACVLRGLEHDEQKELMAGHDEESKVNICAFQRMAFLGALQGAIVTGPFTRTSPHFGFSLDVLGAPIYYTIHTPNGIPRTRTEIDELVVSEVRVVTAVVGRNPPGLQFVDQSTLESHRRLGEGEDVRLKLDLPVIRSCGWSNSILWGMIPGVRKEAGLRIHDRMTTTIPLTANQGHAAILQARETVRAFMVALTILNGGFDVRLDRVELTVEGHRQSVPITFLYQPPKFIRYVPAPDVDGGHRYYHASLRSNDCLDTDGLLWVSRFVDWWLDLKNRHVVHLMTRTDAESSFVIMEGLVRSSWREGNFLAAYEKTLGVAFQELGLSIDEDGRKALTDAHNHRKHVSRYEEHDVFRMTSFSDVAGVVMDFVVVYALIVLADERGEQPTLVGVRKVWKEVVMEMYKKHIKTRIAELPRPMSLTR